MLDSSAAVTTNRADFGPRNLRSVPHAAQPETLLPAPPLVAPFATPRPAPIAETATDRELGQALIERHPAALPAAWRRYAPMVARLLKRALGSESDVDDLVQDVFLGLFKRAGQLRDAEAVRPFILGIARNTLCRERRRRMRRQRLAVKCGREAIDEASVDTGPAARYAELKLGELLQRLPAQERSSFVLRFGYGMTVPEVAEALRVSEPTAKRRLSRARECLGAWAAGNPVLLSYLRRESVATFFVD